MTEQSQEKQQREVWKDEVAELIAGRPRIVKMTKNGDEFYFDITDLPQHINDFIDMRSQGWEVKEKGPELPAYLPARQKMITEDEQLEPSDWGYKKKQTTQP